MGKKRYNSKSRTVANVEIDDSTTKKIVLDIKHREDNYDSCNVFALPAKKRKTKNINQTVTTTRLLSKRRRKHLEKVVERKKKKLQRTTLLEELAKVQVPADELQQYMSITSMQNKGLKRHFQELKAPKQILKRKADEEEEENNDKIKNLSSIKKSNKKRLVILRNMQSTQDKTRRKDPNIVGFTSSDSSSEDNTDNESVNKIHNFDSATSILENVKNEKNDEENFTTKKNKTTPDKPSDLKLEKPVEKVKKLQNVDPDIRTPAVFVPLYRKPEIQAARLKLPITAEEQVIVETINENPIVIITGETGSGKTTQIPQFLYEAGYARDKLIGITEPRRIAAISMSKRVAEEMNLTEKEVSYLIRFQGNVTEETKIKFMTDGVLMKEIQNDFLLQKYSVIILDEAHERSVHTDILIGFLSRIVPLRHKRNNPLKLVIMSATLRVKDFVENPKLFKIMPPVVTVETRQFPVAIHFNKKTSEDYVNEAFRKTVKIHTRLPEGGILIFLTGQQEVHTVVQKLRKAFPWKNKRPELADSTTKESEILLKEEVKEECSEKDDSDDDYAAKEALRRNKQRRKKKKIELPNINLDNYAVIPTDNTREDLTADDEDYLDENEDEDDDVVDFNGLGNAQPLWVLPLYSLLPNHDQTKVFKPPPEGCRLCVVSTNVAETSLTIPNIKYVVDSGRCKTKLYDKVTGVNTFRVCYTSKAAASQRAGRAGRTGPGHCYRLYSSAVYNDQFEEYTKPEIQIKPVDDLLLQMKVMGIDKVVNFPFPSPPDSVQLKSAEKRLMILGALQEPLKKDFFISKESNTEYCAKVTRLGRSIAAFPVVPRYGKMLTLSHQHDLLKYTICMVAAMSVREVLMESCNEGNSTKWLQKRRYWAGEGNCLFLGDLMVLLKAVGASEFATSKGKLLSFCNENGLRYKAMMEIKKLRQQLTNQVNLNIPTLNLAIDPEMLPPTEADARLLRQVVLAGTGDQVAKKITLDEVKEDQDKHKWKYAYRTTELEDPVFLPSSSVLQKFNPEWVVYQELHETNKVYMRGVTAIQPEWLPRFVPTLCRLGEPLTDPTYDPETGKIMCRVTGTFGKAALQLPLINIEYPKTTDGAKWFTYFFLNGEVCPVLKKYVSLLVTPPESVIKPWAKLIPRIQAIKQSLMSHGIISRDKLLEIWASDKTFLLSAYQKWLPKDVHNELVNLWPPI